MKLHASGRDLIIKEKERLISGTVNLYSCEFTFDSEWDGYTVTAVFSTGSRLVNMAVVDGKCDIPVEVLRPNAKVRIGVFGTDGIHSKPTTYSEWITVEQGADVSGNTAQPPTPSVYEQWMNGLDEKHEEWNANEQARIEAEEDRVEAEQKREDLETGYVAQAQEAAESAEAARIAAEKARDEAQVIAGGDFASFAYVDQKASDAESNAKAYTDQKISEIPTPDVSGQIGDHNTDETAHPTMRQKFSQAIGNAVADANSYTDQKIAAIPVPDIKGAQVYEATIGTSWTENEDTGVKSQNVAIEGVTAEHTAKVDHAYTGNGTSDGYATFVEEENQYLTYITNGYAETYDGGVTFYIFGDAPTVSIPVVVEVV